MRIDKKLNLVIPVDLGDGGTAHVHSTPLSRMVFEEHFLVISKTFAAIYRQGLEIMSGPRVAMLLLRQTAREMGILEGPNGVENTLIAEIRRLTNVAYPDPEAKGGWQTYPLQDVIDRKLLSEDDISEVEGAVCFFMCASAMHRRTDLEVLLAGAGSLWGAQTTFSSFTEFVASLRQQTAGTPSPTTTSLVPS